MRYVALVCLTVAATLLSPAAQAAGPVRTAPANIQDWSGVYVGGSVGGGWSRTDWTTANNTTLWGDSPTWGTMANRMSGAAGGIQFGFNYQIDHWVVGLEGQILASHIADDFRYTGAFGAGDDEFNININALALATARFGYVVDRWLGYVKGGYAFARVKASVSDTVAPNTGSGSDAQWQGGPTIGVGAEYALTPNISVGLEYDYVWLNSATHELGDASGRYTWNVKSETQLLLARLNYRFSLPH